MTAVVELPAVERMRRHRHHVCPHCPHLTWHNGDRCPSKQVDQ